jgi:formate dehydrogenase subunit gamma
MDLSPSKARPDLKDVVRSVVDAHRHERGPLLVILQEIQERVGFVPAEAVPLVAGALNLSRADVHGVLTFYHDLRSEAPGRVTVKVCRAEACQSVGAEGLVAALEQRFGAELGQTTSDGTVTLEQVFCLGNCALGPSAEINGRVRGRLDAEQVAALVRTEMP